VCLFVLCFFFFFEEGGGGGGGGVSTLLSTSVVFLLEIFSQVSSQQHDAYNRKGNVK